MPSVHSADPVVAALKGVCGAHAERFTSIDSRWNGNEVYRYDTSEGPFFVKMNRVEDPSIFMLEALSLTTIAKTGTVRVPSPLHVGHLPKVGDIGPGSFMILEYLPLKPFAVLSDDNQAALGEQLAALHQSKEHDALHKGRFGFVVNNFLALTPLNNTWASSWEELFGRRLRDQAALLTTARSYAKVCGGGAAPVPRRPGRRWGQGGGLCARGVLP